MNLETWVWIVLLFGAGWIAGWIIRGIAESEDDAERTKDYRKTVDAICLQRDQAMQDKAKAENNLVDVQVKLDEALRRELSAATTAASKIKALEQPIDYPLPSKTEFTTMKGMAATWARFRKYLRDDDVIEPVNIAIHRYNTDVEAFVKDPSNVPRWKNDATKPSRITPIKPR